MCVVAATVMARLLTSTGRGAWKIEAYGAAQRREDLLVARWSTADHGRGMGEQRRRQKRPAGYRSCLNATYHARRVKSRLESAAAGLTLLLRRVVTAPTDIDAEHCA